MHELRILQTVSWHKTSCVFRYLCVVWFHSIRLCLIEPSLCMKLVLIGLQAPVILVEPSKK
jgi:hypothetical protein